MVDDESEQFGIAIEVERSGLGFGEVMLKKGGRGIAGPVVVDLRAREME